VNTRILTNLAFFTLLGVTLVAWALTSIISVDALRRPFTVTADFASSPGLRSDLEVAYLGVRVGTIGAVRLHPGKVAVQLKMDRGTRVPNGVRAAVLRKSAVGEPYVELSPPTGPDGPPLRAGDHIPLARTTVTVEYKQLFDNAGKLLRATRPQDANTLLRELSNGLEGRGTTLRDLIGDTHQLAGTLADNAATLDSLAVQLTQLTATLAPTGPQLGSGVNDLAAFTRTLRQSRSDLDSLLTRGPGMVNQVNQLLTSSRPGMRCMLHALSAPAPPVFTPANTRHFDHALRVLHTDLPKATASFIDTRPEGSYVRLKPLISLGGPVPDGRLYERETPAPVIPPLYECTGHTASQTGTQPGGQATTPPKTTAGAAVPRGPFVTAAPRAAREQDGGAPWSRWLPLVPVAAAALVLAYTAYRMGATVRRRPRS
jgi:phospholipid/cholesterol/gamma-HCH transport system substrate-binding protein